MNLINKTIGSILSIPWCYNTYQSLAGAFKARSDIVHDVLNLKSGDVVFDLGCGPAEILKVMPAGVIYYGCDADSLYLDAARKKWGERGIFLQMVFSADGEAKLTEDTPQCDYVIALGILHHIDNDAALNLFKMAIGLMKPGAKFVAIDGVWKDNQNFIAKWLLKNDRGKHIRTLTEYKQLAEQVFSQIQATTRSDLMRIPYDFAILECIK